MEIRNTIVELKETVMWNFAFIRHEHLIVKRNSELANDIKALSDKGIKFKIIEIANFLPQSLEGFIDESIKKYL